MKTKIDDNGLTNRELYCVMASVIFTVICVLFVGACIGVATL